MGRVAYNRHKPTEEQRLRVETAAAFGISHKEIARFIGIDHKTLRKHYRDELDLGSSLANEKVSGFVLDTIMGKNDKKGATFRDRVDMARFWLSRRGGESWRDASRQTAPAADTKDKGGVLVVPLTGSLEDWEKTAKKQQAKLKADVRD